MTAGENGSGRIVGRGQDLVGRHHADVARDENQVGEGAADIDAELKSRHARPRIFRSFDLDACVLDNHG